jgi:hypothetical protein
MHDMASTLTHRAAPPTKAGGAARNLVSGRCASGSEIADEEHDGGDDGQRDTHPEKEVEGLNEPSGQKQSDRDDRDDDSQ